MDFSRPPDGVGEARDSTGDSDSGAPSRTEIEAALAKILASRPFATAPRQQALLRHIVTETLEKRGERLKEYSIAVDVFGRAPAFDPRTDSIVRVQASRLRNQLAEYHAKEGAAETVRIDVPAGGYQATFSRVTPAAVATVAESVAGAPVVAAAGAKSPAPEKAPAVPAWLDKAWRGISRASWIVPAVAGAGALAVALFVYGVFIGEKRDVAVALPSGPTVFVAQYEFIDGPEFARILRNGLQYELIDSLSRFPELSVLGVDTVYGRSGDTAESNPRGADFILSGSVQATATDVRVTSQLLETSTNTVPWSRTDRVQISDASGILDVQSKIAGEVAGQLSQPYGVIQERLKEDLTESRAVSLEDYLCVLEAYDYSRAKTSEKHAEVRACLEQVTQHSPSYSPAWAKLSWMYGDEARYGFNRRANDVDPFLRAKAAAERAVTANSSSAMAHQYLAIAQFYLHEDDAFRKSIETALQLNPNNSEILADAAQMLAVLDASERARELAEKAIAMNPGHPAWYYGPLVIYHLMKGNKAEALAAAENGAPDGSPMAGYMLAAALRLNGNEIMANQALESLYATYPDAREKRDEIIASQRLPARMVKLIFGD
jgi:adenylate cyclase